MSVSRPLSGRAHPARRSAPSAAPAAVEAFVAAWQGSGGNETGNAQPFLLGLCSVLGVEPPGVGGRTAAYTFARRVDRPGGGAHPWEADLYKAGCFVLEAKQGSGGGTAAGDLFGGGVREPQTKGIGHRGGPAWSAAMGKAREQAERYARALPDEYPPFLIVCDAGYCLDLYADFSGLGKNYRPFPDPRQFRIPLDSLREAGVRDRLRRVWEDPHSLDPTAEVARVTEQLMGRLAGLARYLEADGHEPPVVARFLVRSLFTMFAEDVGLLPADAFTDLLRTTALPHLPAALDALWRDLDGPDAYSATLRGPVPYFNGKLFRDARALPLSAPARDLLVEAAEADWADVEPAVFGHLLRQVLDPAERGRLGMYCTPRAYVEPLVVEALASPLRREWLAVQAEAAKAREDIGDEAALRVVTAFRDRLARVRVLDPACGSGNFLYVALEHLLALEDEAIAAMQALRPSLLADDAPGAAVSPEQVYGFEVDAVAAEAAEAAIWIGYLRWYLRESRHRRSVRRPILGDEVLVERADALLDADQPDGRRAWTLRRKKQSGAWVDRSPTVILGNPPFIGAGPMRRKMGDAYVDRLRAAYPDVPESADLVMYWWHRAAWEVRTGAAERFGFITTNSVRQTLNRRVVEAHVRPPAAERVPPLCLTYAVPDHPWVDHPDDAAVRVAFTVGEATEAGAPPQVGVLDVVVSEEPDPSADGTFRVRFERQRGVNPDLTSGTDLTGAVPLAANGGLSNRGVQLFGQGFVVTQEKADALGRGRVEGLESHVRPYLNGRDLMGRSREALVIDLYPLVEAAVRRRFPDVYGHVREHVKPERDANRRATYRENWWLFGEPRRELRRQVAGLARFIVTSETAKHRVFAFLDGAVLADNKLVAIASDDPFVLGVLSSRWHVAWATRAGGRLGVGNDPVYAKTRCFETYPFPAASAEQCREIGALAEELDALRKARQAAHPSLTLTDLYNAVDALREGRPLSPAERRAKDDGAAVAVLALHEALGSAVASAYGWEGTPSDAEALARLLALNRRRAWEEAQGHVRYLRPAFQNPGGAVQGGLDVVAPNAEAVAELPAWPSRARRQAQAVLNAVRAAGQPITAGDVTGAFSEAPAALVTEWLGRLAETGAVQSVGNGRYSV